MTLLPEIGSHIPISRVIGTYPLSAHLDYFRIADNPGLAPPMLTCFLAQPYTAIC
jgi:hypothetical protein